MTTFGWKRKAGAKISKEAAKIFSNELEETKEFYSSDDVDWLGNFKRRKINILENSEIKSKRLKGEGATLAENGRYWEAIKKWDEALQLTPHDEKIFEMKAQALMQVNEVFPAVQTAETAVKLNPQWWIAYQTLGHAQLGIGEIKMAINSFSKALHINPAAEELWEDDLKWCLKLLQNKNELYTKIKSCKDIAEEEAAKIIFDDNGFIKEIIKDDAQHDEAESFVQCRI